MKNFKKAARLGVRKTLVISLTGQRNKRANNHLMETGEEDTETTTSLITITHGIF